MKNQSSSLTKLAALIFVGFLITLIPNTAVAQSVTDGSTPSGIAPGSPAGSYGLSGFDTINLFNGNLDARPALLKIGGRGGTGMTVAAGLNPEPWVVKGTGVSHDWWSGLKPGYGPGVMQGRRVGLPFNGPGQACSQDGLNHYRWTRTTLTFSASDGTEFELWDKLSGGPWIDAGSNYCSIGSSRGTEFVSADGTSARFVSDSVITDRNRYYTNTEPIIFPSGYLVLRDGTRYRISNGLVSWRSNFDLGYLPGVLMSDGRDNMVTPSTMVAHELAHAWYRMCGLKDRDGSNKYAVDFENKVRKLQYPNGPTRRLHNVPVN